MDKPLNVRAAIAAGLTVEWHGADYPGWYVKRTRVAHELVGGVEGYWDTVPAYSTVGEAMGLLGAWHKAKPGRCVTVTMCRNGQHEVYLFEPDVKMFYARADEMPDAAKEAIASTP